MLGKLLDEANGWQAGGNSYTVQFRGPHGVNKMRTSWT